MVGPLASAHSWHRPLCPPVTQPPSSSCLCTPRSVPASRLLPTLTTLPITQAPALTVHSEIHSLSENYTVGRAGLPGARGGGRGGVEGVHPRRSQPTPMSPCFRVPGANTRAAAPGAHRVLTGGGLGSPGFGVVGCKLGCSPGALWRRRLLNDRGRSDRQKSKASRAVPTFAEPLPWAGPPIRAAASCHLGPTVLCGDPSLGRRFRSASGGPREMFASRGFPCRKSPF